MNFVLMAGVMILMIVFFHGRGHHGSSEGHRHHSAQQEGSASPTPEPASAPRIPAPSTSAGSNPAPEGASVDKAIEAPPLPSDKAP
jgi:hypothetical protein